VHTGVEVREQSIMNTSSLTVRLRVRDYGYRSTVYNDIKIKNMAYIY
jgi:hypothetical protein